MSKCKFKVGDKVKLIGDPRSVWGKSLQYGKIATIGKIDEGCSYPYTMKEPDNGYIWRDSELKLVEQTKIVITTDGVKYVTAKLYDGDTVKVAEAKCAPEDTFDFLVGAKLACERLTAKETEWRVVNRPVKVGDYIRITRVDYSFDHIGDILKVDEVGKSGSAFVYEKNHPNIDNKEQSDFTWCYTKGEYEVVEKVTKTTEPPKPTKPTYYNGKVVCVKSPYPWFTIGKIYEVKDGILTADDNNVYPMLGHDPYRDAADVRHAGCGSEDNGRHNFKNEFIPLVED